MRQTRGFTLIELLVLIGILGILAALLLAAVQSAREASRRLRCASQLRQIALAMANYCSINSVFPTAYPSSGSRRVPPKLFSAFVRILPELEQSALFHSVNFSARGFAVENATAASHQLAILLCPTDDAPIPKATGPTNYRLNMGSGVYPDRLVMSPGEAGPFETFRWITPSQITDGLSTTALIGEKTRGDGDAARWGRHRDFWFAGCPASPTDLVVGRCADIPGGIPPHNSWAGASWFYSDFTNTGYNHAVEPNSATPDCSTFSEEQGSSGGAGHGVFAARSLHGDGVNTALADGSVRWITSGISRSIWRALGTRAGNEVVSSDSF